VVNKAAGPKTKQEWNMEFSELYPYDDGTVRRVAPNAPGVYRMTYLANDNKQYVFYVGQAEDLESRLLEHLQVSEPNGCIREMVRSVQCRFQFVIVRSKFDRDKLETDEIARWNPKCNKRK
jgi:excinuclease UvrABC nuclease subunit